MRTENHDDYENDTGAPFISITGIGLGGRYFWAILRRPSEAQCLDVYAQGFADDRAEAATQALDVFDRMARGVPVDFNWPPERPLTGKYLALQQEFPDKPRRWLLAYYAHGGAARTLFYVAHKGGGQSDWKFRHASLFDYLSETEGTVPVTDLQGLVLDAVRANVPAIAALVAQQMAEAARDRMGAGSGVQA